MNLSLGLAVFMISLSPLAPAPMLAGSSGDPSAALGPPTELGALPTEAMWPEDARKKIDAALADYGNDQVSAYLTFQQVLKAKRADLSTEQAQWLEDSAALLSSRVTALLRRDVDVGAANRDFRRAYIAWLTLAENGFEIDSVLSGLPSMTEVMKTALEEGKGVVSPVWEIRQVVGEFMPSFSESVFMTNKITLTPGAGRRLLRVRALVKNISADSDPGYVRWSLGDLKRSFLSMGETPPEPDSGSRQPSRLASDVFIQVVSGSGQYFPCEYVPSNSAVLSSQWVKLIGGGNVDPARAEFFLRRGQPGGFVEQGTSFELDVFFSVPEDEDDLRLLILGSSPVPIKVQGN